MHFHKSQREYYLRDGYPRLKCEGPRLMEVYNYLSIFEQHSTDDAIYTYCLYQFIIHTRIPTYELLFTIHPAQYTNQVSGITMP